MTVSARDRQYMRRIGEAKAASHAEAAARHRALPLAERLRLSWAVYLAGRSAIREPGREEEIGATNGVFAKVYRTPHPLARMYTSCGGEAGGSSPGG